VSCGESGLNGSGHPQVGFASAAQERIAHSERQQRAERAVR
jgi:hypothetical protein